MRYWLRYAWLVFRADMMCLLRFASWVRFVADYADGSLVVGIAPYKTVTDEKTWRVIGVVRP